MKPAPFDYAAPETTSEALALLAEHGARARILAGGQSLTAMLNMRLLSPELLIDISRIEALQHIELSDGCLRIGAGVTQSQLLRWPQLAEQQPLLRKLLPFVGHYQTRSRGTVCGSLVHADPSSELPLALAVLDGEVEVASATGSRRLRAGTFQLGMMTTALADDEMVIAARFPCHRSGTAYGFREVSQRHGDFALAAFAVRADAATTAFAIAGVAPKPVVFSLERNDDVLAQRLNEIAWQLGAADDTHASARYRRELVRRIGRQTLEETWRALPRG